MRIIKSTNLSTVKACLSIFRIKTAEGFQYRIAGLAGASVGIFWALIEITVYTVFYTYSNNKEAGIIAGLNLKQVVSYTWLAEILLFLQPTSIDGDILKKITSGDVGIELCRPLDLYLHWFAKSAASRLTPLFWRGSITLIFGMVMPPSYRLSPPETLLGLTCMLISLISALLLCTAFTMLICAVRLNIIWGDGPTNIITLLGGVLSGSYLPLQLWPKFMQNFLIIQPFAGYLDIPLRFYIGTLAPNNAVWAVSLQLIWAVVFIIAGKALMSWKLKSIIVQGG